MDGIKVKVFDIRNGMRVYDNIKIIRIISKDYNLLIMKDYLPIIGEIEGSVDIKNDVVNESFKDIKAFYMNSDNVFNLMIKEGQYGEYILEGKYDDVDESKFRYIGKITWTE